MFKEEELEKLTRPEYWDDRYTSDSKPSPDGGQPIIDSYEWFRTFQNLKPFFGKHLPGDEGKGGKKHCLILHLGCGNSTLTADLHSLGYINQINIDFSRVVIDAMKVKYAELDSRWCVMDLRDMKLDDGTIDIAVDKSTLDAFLHGSIWDPPEDVRRNVGKYVDEVARVLKPGGKWLYITFRQPHFMKPLLAREEKWMLEVEVLEDPDGAGGFEYFGFIMTRNHNP